MADYNFHGLNPRDFQHLIQAIARKAVSPGITAFGDGRDGGRDLCYDGPMNYPATMSPWSGYVVIGCKFRQRPTFDPKQDASWALEHLKEDLEKFVSEHGARRCPDYYIFATNIALTAVEGTGSRARVNALLESYRERLGLKAYSIWDYNDLRGFVDGEISIRFAYGHLITAGDVLGLMQKQLSSLRADFIEVMHLFLQKELLADKAAKLQSAGEHPGAQIPLASVFVDLPFGDTLEAAVLRRETKDHLPKVVATLLRDASRVLRRAGAEADSSEHPTMPLPPVGNSKFAIVGGPGQGKSTFGQYLCQLYRAAILRDRPHHLLDERVLWTIRQLEEHNAFGGLPVARRFPIRIELRDFAQALSADGHLTLFEHIRRDISKLANTKIDKRDLKSWLATYPWLLILDGLDEVPPSSNRARLLAEIDSFQIDAKSCNADLMIVATTRPQGYSNEFSEKTFRYLYLAPLTEDQALDYARKLVRVRCDEDSRRADELLKSLEKACQNSATSRLMQSPLQVTIMATLIEDTGEPPQQRYRLFAEYYRTIYKRETRRKLLDGILSERNKDIDTIHAHAGLLLHAASEVALSDSTSGSSRRDIDSALSDQQFRELVKRRLHHIGVAPAKAADLLDSISDGSLQRLVFLVRQTEGWVRFDVASFKEFMAAEAIMTGSDDEVRGRMQAIAPASYWRNVFQFVVGKCFLEKEHLLDTIVRLCMSLNDAKSAATIFSDALAGDAAHATLWGSLLALDALSDGTARQYPGFESVFTTIALELLKFPDADTCARLAALYHEDVRGIFEQAIQVKLALKEGEGRLGALHLLAALADREVPWAEALLDDSWPADPRLTRQILRKYGNRFRTEVSRAKVEEMATRVDRYWILHNEDLRPGPDASRCLSPALNALIEEARSGYALNRTTLTIKNLSRWRDFSSSCSIASIHSGAGLWKKICGTEFHHPSWFLVVAASRFGAAPSAANLARELRWLAGAWSEVESRSWGEIAPWPLEECLNRSRSSDDLLKFACDAEAGRLGDVSDWSAAERRWREIGLTDEELAAIPGEGGCSSTETGVAVAFPMSSALVSVKGEISEAEFSAYEKRLADTDNVYVRAYFSRQILSVWQRLIPGMGHFLPSGEQLLALYKHALEIPRACGGIHLDILLSQAPKSLGAAWVELLDIVGRNASWVIPGEGEQWVEQLVSHVNRDPIGHQGLLMIISRLLRDGSPVRIHRSALEAATTCGRRSRQMALTLMCAGVELDDEELGSIALRLLECKGPMGRAIGAAGAVSSIQKAKLARVIMRCAPDGSAPQMEARRALNDYLTSRASALQATGVWEMLKLPPRL